MLSVASVRRAVLEPGSTARSQRARGAPGPSERGGCDGVAALPGCLHALECQRGGDVTAVRGQRGAPGVLPAVARHVAGWSGAVRHVR